MAFRTHFRVFSFTFLGLLLFAPRMEAQTLKERLTGFKAGAHQGGLFSFTFNTLYRFKKVEKTGIDIIEMDLHLTKDGEVVVYHDDTLNMWTKCKGAISDKTLAEVKKCRFKLNKQEIPTLREVLAWAQGRVVINAEFKTREVVEASVDLVREFGAYEWVFFQTKGDPERYYRARARDPYVALLFAPHNEAALDWALSLGDDRLLVIELHKGLRSRQVVDRIHASGKVALEDAWNYVWHFETGGAACNKVYDLGIDIAITNAPVSCVRQRNKAQNHHPVDELAKSL